MHQVYDDEMTFKLVAAASKVSGLPVEVCLEEFGKHFLVYCQKNGYDQILRVLGSNLYDFLTNLDNLHDHLASIYPGMRAPSFRVTRQLNTNQPAALVKQQQLTADKQQQHQDPAGGDVNCNSIAVGSMYLHYYSERAGLSPIVKGLVMAVAREFFQTDILVTECRLLNAAANQQQPPAKAEAQAAATCDDHVVLKIDRKTVSGSAAAAAAAAATAATATTTQEQRAPLPAAEPDIRPRMIQSKSMLNIYDSLSTCAPDSLVNSEIMMQTFPFNVIFDRQFNLVQVGKSLLRVTSLYWQRRAAETTGANNSTSEQVPVKFSDLFRIVRPKIEFTFDAIADHTNQVFVVKTRPLVLNADFRRLKRLSSSSGSHSSSSGSTTVAAAAAAARPEVPRRPRPMCPMDRIAMARRRSAGAQPDLEVSDVPEAPQRPPPSPTPQQQQQPQLDELGDPLNHLSLRLKGQMIVLLGGQLCLYLCSPRVDTLDQLLECGVKMSDFALHDRARELMLMSHTHKEDREAVKKLDQASNDLKKMDTKLRQENKRTNEVLHNIFPAKIATLLSHGNKVESESFDLVTCLYSDIIGFTKMCGSENVRPIDIVRLLNTLYLQFDNLTNIHGVFKVETIGDAYVVVGGLPEPAEDHADRCVKMGLDMVKVIATVRSPADSQPIQMRIGIHSGPVMAGIVGIRVPRYSLFGNTTTLANQLETHGVGGKIHISDYTLKNLIKRDRFVVEDNPNQINAIPFVTYFVTNYLGDETETLKHEKFLEEQLIKDFELMGNKLELVDDSYEQLFARSSGQTTPPKLAAARRQSAAATAAGSSSSIIATSPPQADSVEESDLVATPSSARSRPQPAAALAADQYERLILMDIEEQRSDKEYLRQVAHELSSSILSDALEQVAQVRRNERLLMAAQANRQGAQLELVFRLSERPVDAAAVGTSAGSRRDCCPLCEGQGSLHYDEKHVIRVCLPAFEEPTGGANGDGNGSGSGNGAIVVEDRRAARRQSVGLAPLTSSCEDSNEMPESSSELSSHRAALVRRRVSRLLEWLLASGGRQPIQQLDEPLMINGSSSTALRDYCASRDQPSAAAEASSSSPSSPSLQQQQQQQRGHNHRLQRSPSQRRRDNDSAGSGNTVDGNEDGVEDLEMKQLRKALSQRRRPSIERWLSELREERRKLEEQVDRLRSCQPVVASAAGGSQVAAVCPPVKPPPPIKTTCEQPAAGPISSSIQRMKRMDTLKRRKLKNREQQQQQQQQQQQLLDPPDRQVRAQNSIVEEEAELENQENQLPPERDSVRWASPAHHSQMSNPEVPEATTTNNNTATATGTTPETVATAAQRRASSYSYQNLRLSIAGLLNEVGQQRRKRFSLNPFASFSISSPFGSPVKRAAAAAAADRKFAGTAQVATGSAQVHSDQAQGNSAQPGRDSSCSCLKSSESSQSVNNQR